MIMMNTCLYAHVFFLLGVFPEGLSEMIQTQDAVRTMEGEDARFTCQLTQHKNVVQMTWKQLLPSGGTENVATYSKRNGAKINPPFQGKVEFKDTGLQGSTIVVRNVTKADEGCYKCIFNPYREGAIHRKTCLIVYEQPEPILHITKPSDTEMMVSCSAESHPAPTVTLDVSRYEGPSNNSTIHTANANGTVTVTSTVTMERFCSNSTQVHCVVRFSSRVVKEASRVIYSDEQDLFCDVFSKDKSEADPINFNGAVICATVGVVGIVIIGLVCRFRKKGTRPNNDPEFKALP